MAVQLWAFMLNLLRKRCEPQALPLSRSHYPECEAACGRHFATVDGTIGLSQASGPPDRLSEHDDRPSWWCQLGFLAGEVDWRRRCTTT